MKKLLCLILALLLCPAALADQDNWVEASPELYVGAIEDVLFKVHNVTLTGEASFSLDGEWFKTANAVYRQDGENSYWDYRLTAPDFDGNRRENGYTVVANGQYYYVMESDPHPGTYKSGSDNPQNTVLRKTVQSQSMMTVLYTLANQAYTLLGKDAVSAEADAARTETLHIRLDENTPDHINLALSMFWQYASRRFLDMDTERIDATEPLSIYDFATVSKGVLACTRYLSVKKADLTVVMDANGWLQQISGSASVLLTTVRDGEKQLDATFKLDVTDRGATKVDIFKPADYNVTLYEEEPLYDDETLSRWESITDHAYFSWNKAGFEKEMVKFSNGNHRPIGDYYYMYFSGDEGPESLLTIVDFDGKLVEMQHFDGFEAKRNETPYQDETLVKDTLEKTRAFLEDRYPDVAAQMGEMKLAWWREKDGRVDFCFEQDPIRESHGITLTVRALPEWRIEDVICDSNG